MGSPIEKLNEKEGIRSNGVYFREILTLILGLFRVIQIMKQRSQKINIRDFRNAPKLFVAFTWSEKENTIHVGDYKRELRNARSFKDPNIKFRVGKDGAIYQIGDTGIKVGYYKVKVGEDVILEPTAKEIFDFQMEKIRILIENCKKKGDSLFESTWFNRQLLC